MLFETYCILLGGLVGPPLIYYVISAILYVVIPRQRLKPPIDLTVRLPEARARLRNKEDFNAR